ncbi:metalloregulator ArsR/SmtB family transcription factor [Cytobacillus sp. Hm23]
MAFEQNENNNPIAVDHFSSPVVECVGLLSSFIQPAHHTTFEEDHNQLKRELGEDSLQFVTEWKKNTTWDLMQLLNFLLPCPVYNDVHYFVQQLTHLSTEDFLYHFFGESLSESQIYDGLYNPENTKHFTECIPEMFEDNESFSKQFFMNIEFYRDEICKLIVDVYNTTIFTTKLTEHEVLFTSSINSVKSKNMKPLPLAQYIMGKPFKRLSNYESFLFIPSFYMTPHKIRIFNVHTCLIIYGCSDTTRDIINESKLLEKQLKSLSDSNRLLILRLLRDRKEYGAKLAQYIGVTTATISHHLEILKKAGFIIEEKIGNIKYFSLNQEHFDSFMDDLNKFIKR